MKFTGDNINWPVAESIDDSEGLSREDCGANGVSPGACGLYAAIGEVNLKAAFDAAATMQERGTFGAGVLLRGIYPYRKDYYAFHVMYRNRQVAKELEPMFTEGELGMRQFGDMEPLVTPEAYRKYYLPEMRRYFLGPPTADEMLREKHTSVEDVYVRRLVEEFNRRYMGDARIFSSGKNIGNFVTALELANTIETFDLYQFENKPMSAIMIHMRWPTNIVSSGVWWGAHPISFLNSAIIHNGDLSSSASNKQALEAAFVERMVGTDSEAILLEVDNLITKKKMSHQMVEWVMCQKFPAELNVMTEAEREEYLDLLNDPVLARFKMSGPSSFVAIIGSKVIAGRDRDGLRQLWMGRSEDGKTVIWGSEEKVIYQSAWITEKKFKATNCEPGRLVAFEIGEDGAIKEAFGETLTPASETMPV
ncbi:Glutamine amidotransferase, class-II [hydrothermal vent metagenome]|uniref:Glutamine amidotransferase, class-II n=1 Tax=hydrothermal vent metagenome TaxID=652676 RepID=A0A3B1CGX1_9ZZZZ